MNDQHPPIDANDGWSEQFFQELGAGRLRTQELLEHQRQQLDTLEVDIAAKIEQLSAELSASQNLNHADCAVTERQANILAAQEATIARLTVELAQRETDLKNAGQAVERSRKSENAEASAQRDELDARANQLHAAELALREAQRAQTIVAEELADEQEQLTRLKQRFEQQLLRLETERETLAGELGRTRQQRRRIARELQSERAARLEEFESRKSELQALAARRHEDLEAALERHASEATELRRQSSQLRTVLNQRAAELQERGDKCQQLQTIARQQAQQIAKLNAERERLILESTERDAAHPGDEAELVKLRLECENLRTRLSESERERHDQPGGEAERQKRDDLQRRFELAVSEIRELKRSKSDLETRLAQSGNRTGGRSSDSGSPALDWAAQKQRLLEALEDEGDEDDDDWQAARMTIEGTIRITDQVIAQKDREIAELKELLDQQSTNLGSVAVGAAAIAELFDGDELITQQREKLRLLESEWKEKLRQAEIDISLERAKNARDRAELEQRMAHAQQRDVIQSQSQSDPASSLSDPSKPNKGRWLARLGLKDNNGSE